MEQGASMESVAQFLLGCDTASGKKHYHWNCNCALHGQCGHSSPAKVDVSSSSKNTKSKSISSSSTRSISVSDLTSLRTEKRLHSMGNLLELLDSSKSNEEIRRAAANKEPL